MTPEFLAERIAKCKLRIAAYEDAIDAILIRGVAQYSLTTGQTTQQVTKLNISSLEKMLGIEENRLVTLETRLNGGGSSYMRGGW